jgi:nucleotide-binding universal stress UspA family protein
MTPRIIHATDFSREAEVAEAEAVRLTRALGAELILLHVASETPLYGGTALGMKCVKDVYEAQAQWAEEKLAARARLLATRGVPTGWHRRVGVPHEEIAKTARDEKAACIVVGTRGRGGLERFMLGTVADRVTPHRTPEAEASGRPLLVGHCVVSREALRLGRGAG